jgi:hypothetical protein
MLVNDRGVVFFFLLASSCALTTLGGTHAGTPVSGAASFGFCSPRQLIPHTRVSIVGLFPSTFCGVVTECIDDDVVV